MLYFVVTRRLLILVLLVISCQNVMFGQLRERQREPLVVLMSVVREVVEGELGLNIPIAGLAKDNRHRTNELLYGNPPQTIALKTNSELFHVLTQIQDEVHRYAIQFHRDKRSKHALHSELDDIKGIGPTTRDALLKAFKSLKRIREASVEELTEVIGAAKAKLIAGHFNK